MPIVPTSARTTGTFSVEELQEDHSGQAFNCARRLGEALAQSTNVEWVVAERALRALWSEAQAGCSWNEARPAIYKAWLATRRFFPAVEDAARDEADRQAR